MNLYMYKGPVEQFDRVLENDWEAYTYAVSESKARSNIAYQYKRQTSREPWSKITLPGVITYISNVKDGVQLSWNFEDI